MPSVTSDTHIPTTFPLPPLIASVVQGDKIFDRKQGTPLLHVSRSTMKNMGRARAESCTTPPRPRPRLDPHLRAWPRLWILKKGPKMTQKRMSPQTQSCELGRDQRAAVGVGGGGPRRALPYPEGVRP